MVKINFSSKKAQKCKLEKSFQFEKFNESIKNRNFLFREDLVDLYNKGYHSANSLDLNAYEDLGAILD